MSLPPENLTPSELWCSLTAIPRPHKTVDFPRKDFLGKPIGQLAIWVLTQEEQMACNAEAEAYTRKVLKSPPKADESNIGYSHTFGNAAAIEVLYRACRDPKDTSRPAFPSPKLMREIMTTDEVSVLFEHYLTVQLELGPVVAHMTETEMNAWIARLSEGGSAFPFDLLSSEAQKTLLLFMASRVTALRTDTSSVGLLQEESTPQT